MISIKIFISTSGDTSQGYTYTDNDFKSVKFSDQISDTSFDITPTVIEQYADIVFKDKTGDITEKVISGVFNKYLKVFVYINNVWKYTYITSTWDIQVKDKTVTLHCNDPVKLLENKQTQLVEPADKTLADMFAYAQAWSGYPIHYGDGETIDICQRTVLKNTYVPYMNLLDFIKKLCVTGFIRFYWNKNRFVIARCL